jgi:hypothetical protein
MFGYDGIDIDYEGWRLDRERSAVHSAAGGRCARACG